MLTSNQQSNVPGEQLLELIHLRLGEQNLTIDFVVELLQISKGYWYLLNKGTRPIGGLSKPLMKILANWLGISLVEALVLAGELDPMDLQAPDLTGEAKLRISLIKMRADPKFAFLAPADDVWNATPISVRHSIVVLYEKQFLTRLTSTNT